MKPLIHHLPSTTPHPACQPVPGHVVSPHCSRPYSSSHTSPYTQRPQPPSIPHPALSPRERTRPFITPHLMESPPPPEPPPHQPSTHPLPPILQPAPTLRSACKQSHLSPTAPPFSMPSEPTSAAPPPTQAPQAAQHASPDSTRQASPPSGCASQYPSPRATQ